jgi:hypothetical protein
VRLCVKYTGSPCFMPSFPFTTPYANLHRLRFLTSDLTPFGGLLTKKLSRVYRVADKSLVRPTPRCILFDGENISFDASLVIYINSTNIPPIMVINRIYETQNLLSL